MDPLPALAPLHIGLTYDLRSAYLAAGYGDEETAEFDRDDTIDALEHALRTLGHTPERIGSARELAAALAAGKRWDLVFNICEGLRGLGRESQVPTLLELYGIAYTFSDPAVMDLCLHKGLAKLAVRDAGLATPAFRVVRDPADLARGWDGWRFPLFVKPVAEGTSKGVSPASKVPDVAALEARCAEIWAHYDQPALVEEFLSGREFTVSLLGTGATARVLGTLEIVLLPAADAEVYSYRNKEECEVLVEYRWVRGEDDPTVARAEADALAAWRVLGCCDAGRIDLRCDATGAPQFLEANPLAGLHPTHSDIPILANEMGLPYVELIRQIVAGAWTRALARRRRTPLVPTTAGATAP
jgi:D-alanine-D-alanine ligase